MTADFVIRVDDVEHASHEGDTVAAVLVRAGYVSWRRTRTAYRPRGLFCGMGACQDCLVSVDGVDGVRACLAPTVDGMVVETETETETSAGGHG